MGSVEKIRAVAERVVKTQRDGYTKLAVVASAMSGETNRLVDLVTKVNPNANPNHFDMVVSSGEQVSIALLSSAIESLGVKSKPLLGYQLGIHTDSAHSKARIKSIETEKLEALWSEGWIPVVAGFQGVSQESDITTLGRGGSDTSAVALAAATNAGLCEINTDVKGVYSSDPRSVVGARLIQQLDYDVALEMAALGSKVLHPRCVELGSKFSIPIVVRSTFNEDESERTIIMKFDSEDAIESPLVSGVTIDRNVAKFTVTNVPIEPDFIPILFQALAEQSINVDIIVHDKLQDKQSTRIGYTVETREVEHAKRALSTLKERQELRDIEYEVHADLAKVSAVGVGMQSHPGVASRIFTALARHNIPIHMISTSEIKVSCVIDDHLRDQAAQAIHDNFFSN